VFDWGDRRIFYLHIGDRIMVWLGGRITERPDKLDSGCSPKLGGVPQNNLNLEALKF
jgi:hypothetical protein